MSRGKRYRIPGFVWHITQRCHNRDFLLKFARDKEAWLSWLYDAKIRYRVAILNYSVTSNHTHLLLRSQGEEDLISRAIQLTASRVAREYNQRKQRSGAFWDDHYQATAVSTDVHFQNCLTYIDLNMVRAGVVTHPGEWPFGGFAEIEREQARYRILDTPSLMQILEIGSPAALRDFRREAVRTALASGRCRREPVWTESAAIGNPGFLRQFAERLGSRANAMRMEPEGEGFALYPAKDLRITPLRDFGESDDDDFD